jgi:capsular polysaccharide biosynthesis protein
LGLFVGLGLAFLAYYLDATLRHQEDLEALGLTVIATLPRD